MAITKGAKKAVRSSERKRVYNLRTNNTMRDIVKSIRKSILAGESDKAKAMLPTAYKAIDKAAKRGVIKDNTASRKKSRLTAAINKVTTKK